MWRGGCRLNMSVAASFDWRCLSGSTMAPFPHPVHRTGQADFPHPALGQDFTPLLYARWLTTVSGRVGYAWDRVLLYAKGGGAWVATNTPAISVAGTPASFTSTS